MGNSSYVAEKFSPCLVRVDSQRNGTELPLGEIQDPQIQGNTSLSPYTLTFTYTLAHTSDTKQIPPC